MKKTVLWVAALSIAMLASCSRASEPQPIAENSTAEFTTLEDVFDQLSQIPGVAEDTFPNMKFRGYEIKVEKSAVAKNLNRQQIEDTGNAMYAILDKVPMGYIVNGATNHLAAGFVYANRLSDDNNEVLMVACSGAAGMYAAYYGTANNSTVTALQMAPLSMQGQHFTLTLEDTPTNQIYLYNFYN